MSKLRAQIGPPATMRALSAYPRHGDAALGPHEQGWDRGRAGPPPRRFATRAEAQLLDALGWQIAASPRREVEWHEALQCCFVLRDGRREEAAFGYAGLSLPDDPGDAALAAARATVERFLAALGEDRGVMLQNMPLVALGRHRPDRIAVFGGWRFAAGRWRPLLLGPGGLGGVEAQAALFDAGTDPADMAEVCGHPTARVLPRVAALVAALAAPAAGPGLSGRVRLAPWRDGWSALLPAAAEPQPQPVEPLRRTAAFTTPVWHVEADEFRFHRLGADRG